MARLTIERSNEWVNKIRKIDIYLDNEKLGAVGNGKAMEFDIETGTHTIYCKIDWCSSIPVTFEIGDDRGKTFRLFSFAYGSWWRVFLASYYIAAKRDEYIQMEEVFI
jgi:hypothetical protein